MKSQTEDIVNLNRTKLDEDLRELETQKIITSGEFNQMQKRLNADFDNYLKHQDIDLKGLENMFFATIKSFENIKINQPIFTVITSRTFHTITGRIAMRSFPKAIKQEDYNIQAKLNNVMNDWFENYQNESEKITDLIYQINKEKKLKIYSDISSSDYADIIATITRIKNDTTFSANQLKKILTDGMLKYCNKGMNSNLAILNIYGSIDRIKKLGIDDQLSAIYEKRQKKPEEISYGDMKLQITSRFKMLLREEMITQQEYEKFNKIIIDDIDFCEKNRDKALIKTQLLSSLNKLKTAELDTEDREAIANYYFVLTQKKEIDIKSDLNKWLYGFELN